MKNILLLLILMPILFISCLKDECTSTRIYAVYDPVYLHQSEFRKSSIELSESYPLEIPGKLYFYQNYLLINEQGKGIHFYDVSDDANPKEIVFYHLPGNFDMAINNDILYVDVVVDLVALNIQDIKYPKIVNRVENYKNNYIPEDGMHYAYSVRSNRTEVLDCSDPNFGIPFFFRNNREVFLDVALPTSSVAQFESNAGSGGGGVGGSFARFTISKEHMYTVDQSNLITWDIDGNSLEKIGTRNMGWGIETIYPFGNYLFIGSNSGMFIYDNNNPVNPTLVSTFSHATACDPVVTDGQYAYVTLRDGNQCQGFVNQLDVIDLTNIRNPNLVESYSMKNPHGLSVYGDYLFLGEGKYGFKIIDKSNPEKIKTVSYYEDIATYDVIALSSELLFIVGENGFYLAKVEGDELKIKSSILVEEL